MKKSTNMMITVQAASVLHVRRTQVYRKGNKCTPQKGNLLGYLKEEDDNFLVDYKDIQENKTKITEKLIEKL